MPLCQACFKDSWILRVYGFNISRTIQHIAVKLLQDVANIYWLTKETLHLNSKPCHINVYTWSKKWNYESFLLLMACLCCTLKLSVQENLMVEIKIFKNKRLVSLVFVKNSKRHARDMVFWKRTIIMANKDESCVLTQICIAFKLILACRWYVKLTLTSSVTSEQMPPFSITRQIFLTHVANNWHVQF